MKHIARFFILLSILIITSCQSDDDIDNDFTDGIDINDVPVTGNIGAANPTKLAALGRLLFWDPILFGEKDIACATCHHPNFGYADGRDLPIGVGSLPCKVTFNCSLATPQLSSHQTKNDRRLLSQFE